MTLVDRGMWHRWRVIRSQYVFFSLCSLTDADNTKRVLKIVFVTWCWRRLKNDQLIGEKQRQS